MQTLEKIIKDGYRGITYEMDSFVGQIQSYRESIEQKYDGIIDDLEKTIKEQEEKISNLEDQLILLSPS